MALFKKNETKNVSSTKGVKGGYIFVAPAGTTLPTDIKIQSRRSLPQSRLHLRGRLHRVEETDANELKDMNGDLMDSATTSRVESAKLTLAEIKAQTLKVMYGAENVTDLDGVITVEHNGNKDEAWSIVLELVLKNGRRWRKVVPFAKLSELDDLKLAVSEIAGRQITLKYLVDSDGNTCYDYIESTETASA